MKDCWRQLDIAPTNDPAEIKRAWRTLVKQYHPDTVKTPEKKRKYTIRCAEINGAYRDALKAAQATSRATHPSTTRPASPEAKAHATQTWRDLAVALFSLILAITVLIAVVAGMHYAIFGLDSLPKTHFVRIGIAFVVALLGGSLLLGGIVAGVLDLFFAAMFPGRLLEACGLSAYEDKLTWLWITAFNSFLFFYADFLGKPSGFDEPVATALDLVTRSAAAFTIPMLLALDWLRDLFRLRRLNTTPADLVAAIATVDAQTTE